MNSDRINLGNLESNISYLVNMVKVLKADLMDTNKKKDYFTEWQETLRILQQTQDILGKKTNEIYELELELMKYK